MTIVTQSFQQQNIIVTVKNIHFLIDIYKYIKYFHIIYLLFFFSLKILQFIWWFLTSEFSLVGVDGYDFKFYMTLYDFIWHDFKVLEFFFIIIFDLFVKSITNLLLLYCILFSFLAFFIVLLNKKLNSSFPKQLDN